MTVEQKAERVRFVECPALRLAREQSLSKSEIAARMKTSRAAVDRLLDASNPSVTLTTLGKTARALGRKVKIITHSKTARVES